MASRGVNKVVLIGNLGGDPEVRYSQSGAAIANCTIATSESWKDKQTGEMMDRVEWHRVVFFNRLGEVVSEFLRKGSKVYVEGQLRTRKWQDNDGNDRYTTEIVAKEMQMLDSRGDGQGQQQQPQQQSQAPQQRQQAPQGQQQGGYVQPPAYQGGQQGKTDAQPPQGGIDDFEDDIPFAPYMRMMAV